jgi:DNA-directed RNA polymerase specialized sigma24 family protein
MTVTDRPVKDELLWRPSLDLGKTSSGVIQAVILQALQLRRAYREVFILCDIQGRSIDEAAVLLDVLPAVATARLERARRQMDAVTQGLCEH